jgi:small neutral amino acid transporter SnatA (MarC family)
MAKALTVPAKLKEVSKSLKVNWRIFFTIVLFAFTVNLSILSEGLFLTEIIIAGGIITLLVAMSQMAPKPSRTKQQ